MPIDPMPISETAVPPSIPVSARKSLVTCNLNDAIKQLMEMNYYSDALFLASWSDPESLKEVQVLFYYILDEIFRIS